MLPPDAGEEYQPRPAGNDNPYGKPDVCRTCPAFKRPGPVWGTGPKDARSYHIAECPGVDEVSGKVMEPLIGRTGKYFDVLLKAVGEDRSLLRVGNAVACLPPEARDKDGKLIYPVTPEIFQACRPHFDRFVRKDHPPHHIHLMGSWAAARFVGDEASIKGWQGGIIRHQEYEPGGLPSILTFSMHPATAFRDPMMTAVIQDCFQRAARVARMEEIPRREFTIMDMDLPASTPPRPAWGGTTVIPYSQEAYEWLFPATGYVYFDTETTNKTDKIINRISIATCDRGALTVEWSAKVREWLRPLFENTTLIKVAHHFQFDHEVLWNAGIRIPYAKETWICTMTASGIIYPDLSNSLEFSTMLARPGDHIPWKHMGERDPVTYSGIDSAVLPVLWQYEMDRLEERDLWPTFWRTMRAMPIVIEGGRVGIPVNGPEAEATRERLLQEIEAEKASWHQDVLDKAPRRRERAEEALQEAKALEEEADRAIEARAAEIADLQQRGLKKKLSAMPREATSALSKARKLREKADKDLHANFNSPQQMAQLFYDDLGLEKKFKRGTLKITTDADAILALGVQNPTLRKILEFREKQKVATTFFGDKMTGRHEQEGDRPPRLRFSVNLTRNTEAKTSGRSGTSTGRHSMTPSPQVMPGELRHIWLPDDREGGWIVAYDWSGAEMFVIAYVTGKLVGDWRLWEYLVGGGDVYVRFAAQRLGIPEDQVTPGQRQEHKSWSLGINYGLGPNNAADAWGCSRIESREIITAYLKSMFGLEAARTEIVRKGTVDRMLRNFFGRIRHFPSEKYAPEMLNFHPQTGVSDLLLITMGEIQDQFQRAFGKERGPGLQLLDYNDAQLAQVARQATWIHDAAYASVPDDLLQQAVQIVHVAANREWSPWMPGFRIPATVKVGRCMREFPKKKPLGEWNGRDLIPWSKVLYS